MQIQLLQSNQMVVKQQGTLKMTDEVAVTKQTRDMAGRPSRKKYPPWPC